eukprot:6210701-Pleurochrysis_carterae.AAC.1
MVSRGRRKEGRREGEGERGREKGKRGGRREKGREGERNSESESECERVRERGCGDGGANCRSKVGCAAQAPGLLRRHSESCLLERAGIETWIPSGSRKRGKRRQGGWRLALTWSRQADRQRSWLYRAASYVGLVATTRSLVSGPTGQGGLGGGDVDEQPGGSSASEGAEYSDQSVQLESDSTFVEVLAPRPQRPVHRRGRGEQRDKAGRR